MAKSSFPVEHPPASSAVVCNPVDLPYRYQDVRMGGVVRSVSREAADPSVVRYMGRYYMFASMSAGFWHSPNLVDWQYRPSRALPAYDYAPDAREIDGKLYVCASRRSKPSPFFCAENPLEDDFVQAAPGTFPFWDPNLFEDKDGRVYFYWGCSNKTPIKGVEMDPATLTPVGRPVDLIGGHPDKYGWERTGENHHPTQHKNLGARLWSKLMGDGPFIEGAWMTEHAGTYYLQYAAPGAELGTYADGYYTGTSPLGPFTYSPASPFSSKPGGFMTGAGHGSTFQDAHGNWWHAATMRVSVNFMFERRVGIFPAGFDEDGVLFCNQNFADYPMIMPDRKVDPWTDLSPGWMLLSYKKEVTASSSLPDHSPDLAVNEDARTWWVAGTNRPGETLTVDLGDTPTVYALQVNLADHDLRSSLPKPRRGTSTYAAGALRHIDPADNPTEYHIEGSLDGTTWSPIHDNRGTGSDSPHGFIVLTTPGRYRHLRITGYAMPYGGHFAVSGLRVFGRAEGPAPVPTAVHAMRIEPRNALVRWEPSAGANGYNVRYGHDPEKLYHSWLVHEQTELNLSSLNAGEDYWVAVDAFNECGVTPGKVEKIR